MKHEYKLSQKDYDVLNQLVRITSSIKKLYDTLIDLEVNDKKYSVEYKNTLDYLDMCKEVENELYEKNLSDISLEHEVLKYMNQVLKLKHDTSLSEEICSNRNLVLNRIFKRIYNMANRYVGIEHAFFPEEIKTFASSWYESLAEDMVADYYDNYYLPKIFRNEIKNLIYKKIDFNCKNNSFLENNKKQFIKLKYNMAFLDEYIENNLMDTNFSTLIKFDDKYENKTIINTSDASRQEFIYGVSVSSVDDLTKVCKDNNYVRLMIDEFILSSCAELYDSETLTDVHNYCEILRLKNQISEEKERVLIRSGILTVQ